MLADAEALLTCYGVGEETGSELLHAVVELCFTSSVRFLQPGLLLKVIWLQQASLTDVHSSHAEGCVVVTKAPAGPFSMAALLFKMQSAGHTEHCC